MGTHLGKVAFVIVHYGGDCAEMILCDPLVSCDLQRRCSHLRHVFVLHWIRRDQVHLAVRMHPGYHRRSSRARFAS